MRARVVFLLVLVSLAFLQVSRALADDDQALSFNTSSSHISPSASTSITIPPQLDSRQLILDWPESLLQDDSDQVTLIIAADEGAQDGSDLQGIYATHNVVAVAHLEMAGVQTERVESHQPLGPGKEVTFRWDVRAGKPGSYDGTIWLRFELVPKAGGPVEEVLVLAKPVQIDIVTILGLSGSQARWLSGMGLLVSLVLVYPYLPRRGKRR